MQSKNKSAHTSITFAALPSAVRGPARYIRFLYARQRLAALLEESLTQADLIKTILSLIEDAPELAQAIAASSEIRGQLARDIEFLIAAAQTDNIRKRFFGAKSVRETAASFTSIRNEVIQNLDFLVNTALNDGRKKEFFSNERIRKAAASFTSIQNEVVQNLDFLVGAALDDGRKKEFFSNERIRKAAASFTSIREEITQDVRFLISSSLTDQHRRKFYQNARVHEAFWEINPPNEDSAVKLLSSKWTNRQRQLNGFNQYLTLIEKLQDYYGDCEAIRRLTSASIPPEGFPSDVHLRDFLCAHLCDGKTFHMRDAKLQIVDEHAIWTLINEILVDQEYYFESDNDEPFIIDCGANFGMSTIYFKQLYSKARVLAFEPVPFLHKLAVANVKANGYANVEIVKKGLSSNKGEARFYLSREYSMAGSLTDRRVKFGDEIEELRIQTVPLSDYIDREVDFLKLDIEGSEGEVLLELGDKLSLVKRMCVEWHMLPGNEETVRLDQILTLLSKHGFDYQIGKSGSYAKKTKTKPMSYVGDLGTLNFWAVRR